MGFFVDKVVERITPKQEQWLWNQLKSEYINEKNSQVLNRPTQKIRKILQRIPLDKLRFSYPYKVYVIKNPIPNAYAMPGGNIIVTSSILEAIPDKDGILFVLCHELGHFQNRDHLKKLGRSLVMTRLLKWIFGPGVASVYARFSLLYERAYSRSEELKADLWGLYLLYHAKGNMSGVTKFLDWVSAHNFENSPLERFLSTHPNHNLRRERLEYWLKTNIYKDANPIVWDKILIGKKVNSLIKWK